MESIYLLVPISVVLVFLIALIFWWSVKSGQFDDLEGPGFRVLMDDDRPPAKSEMDSEGQKKIKVDLGQQPHRENHENATLIGAFGSIHFSVGVGVRYGAPFFCP